MASLGPSVVTFHPVEGAFKVLDICTQGSTRVTKV